MKTDKSNRKNLIQVEIYSAICFVIVMATAMLSYILVFMP